MKLQSILKKYENVSYAKLVDGFKDETYTLNKEGDNYELYTQLNSFLFFIETGELPEIGVDGLRPFLNILRRFVENGDLHPSLLEPFELPPPQ